MKPFMPTTPVVVIHAGAMIGVAAFAQNAGAPTNFSPTNANPANAASVAATQVKNGHKVTAAVEGDVFIQ